MRPTRLLPGAVVIFVALALYLMPGVRPTSTLVAPVTPITAIKVAEQPITGCGQSATVPSGTSADAVLAYHNLLRAYRVHVPLTYTAAHPVPLVLVFHGHSDHAAHFEALSGFSQLADQANFVVVYPQGTLGPDHLTGWATGYATNPTVDDVGFVSALISHLQATLCIDRTRIYATGFSNGGGMTNELACDLAQRIAAFAPVAGAYHPLPGGCHPARPVPLLEIHGTADTVVPYLGSPAKDDPPIAEWLSAWAVRDDCMARPTIMLGQSQRVTESWTDCGQGVTITHVRLVGWTHTWPTNEDAAIWAFFQANPLPGAQPATVPATPPDSTATARSR